MSSFLDYTGLSRLASKINNLLAGKESSSNKKTDVPTNGNSDTYYPTCKAVYDFVKEKYSENGGVIIITKPLTANIGNDLVLTIVQGYYCAGRICNIGIRHNGSSNIFNSLEIRYYEINGARSNFTIYYKVVDSDLKIALVPSEGLNTATKVSWLKNELVSDISITSSSVDNTWTEFTSNYQYYRNLSVQANVTKLPMGDTSLPVYVNANGFVQPCADIGKEFWISDTTSSSMYITLGSITLESGGGLSRLELEIGALGCGYSQYNAGKLIVHMGSFRGDNKVYITRVNIPGDIVPNRCRFYTYTADGKMYLVAYMLAYSIGAYAKVISHGRSELPWEAGVLDRSATAPATLTESNVTYQSLTAT